MKNGNPQRLVIKPHVETHGRACNNEWSVICVCMNSMRGINVWHNK